MDITHIMLWIAGAIGTLGALAIGLVVIMVSGFNRGHEDFSEPESPFRPLA